MEGNTKNPKAAEMLANQQTPQAGGMPQGQAQPPPVDPMANPQPGVDPATPNTPAQPEAPVEPLGAQILRRIHKDHLALMEEYHEMLGHLEHEHVKGFLVSALSNMDSVLTATEDMFMQIYMELPGLEGAEVPDEAMREMEEPTAEEAVEGMELERNRDQMKMGKSLKPRKKTLVAKKKAMMDDEVCDGCGYSTKECACESEMPEGTPEGMIQEEQEFDEEGNPIEYEDEYMEGDDSGDVIMEEDFQDDEMDGEVEGEINEDEYLMMKEQLLPLLQRLSGEDSTLEQPDKMEAFHMGKCLNKMVKSMGYSSNNAVASPVGNEESDEDME